ncbi:unnamed protein product [marine sediment metagenome]|uniref:Uncharacterized protein n=1 Tax=marine sediment metagenome TaxID=412755 RepID=X1VMS2_9ZZZZ
MELTPSEVDWIVIVYGRTYEIKDELKSLGFRWSQANKAWYHLGLFKEGQCEYLAELLTDPSWPGIFIRLCSLDVPISLLV